MNLCNSVGQIIVDVMKEQQKSYPIAICFGGTHYPEKFTNELIHGKYSLGTVIPKYALDHIDQSLFSHIIKRNMGARVGKKEVYVIKVRSLRYRLKIAKDRKEITNKEFWALYKKIGGNTVRNIAHLRTLIDETISKRKG